jgi:glycerol-3-phosphate O-acyltransferase / dihydroxyacetone phosphate acyltransferase
MLKPIVEALSRSTVKIQAHDVVGTWKVLISLCFAPILYIIYASIGVYVASKARAALTTKIGVFLATLVVIPLISFAALKFGEAGLDVVK